MAKFPNWDRPLLAERQLVGEERRLEKRGLTAEQVRADLIIAASHHEGASRNAVLHDLAATLDISQVYLENALSGRMPFGDALLDGLYGPSPAGTRPEEWVQLDDFGPLLPDAIRAGLAAAPEDFNSGAGGFSSHVPPPTPVAVPARLDTAPTASPVVADATPPVADPDICQSADQATPATSSTTSQRAPEGIAPIGEGEQGAPDLADPAGSSPVQQRETAGEGAVGSAGLSPPPTPAPTAHVTLAADNSFTAAPDPDPWLQLLNEMSARALRAQVDVKRAEAAVHEAEMALIEARGHADRMHTAQRELAKLIDELTTADQPEKVAA